MLSSVPSGNLVILQNSWPAQNCYFVVAVDISNRHTLAGEKSHSRHRASAFR